MSPSCNPTPNRLSYCLKYLPAAHGAPAVLTALLQLCDDKGLVAAAIGRIANLAHVTDKCVKKHLKRFEAAGWIEYQYRSKGKSDPLSRVNRIRVLWPVILSEADAREQTNTRAAQPPSTGTVPGPHGRGNGAFLPAVTKGERRSPVSVSSSGVGGSLHSTGSVVHEGEGGDLPADAAVGRGGSEPSWYALPPLVCWADEFTGTEGVGFETVGGLVYIPPPQAERWVAPFVSDGAALLRQARDFLSAREILPPTKLHLVPVVADLVRKLAQGYTGGRLALVVGNFDPASWRTGREAA